MNVLADKVAIVTGASSGIGRATALLFAREGAKIVVTARRQSELDRLVAEINKAGGEAVPITGDVKDESLAKALVDNATSRFGLIARVMRKISPSREKRGDAADPDRHSRRAQPHLGQARRGASR